MSAAWLPFGRLGRTETCCVCLVLKRIRVCHATSCFVAGWWGTDDFINAVRDATVPPLTVHGPGSFIPYDFALDWPTAKLRTLLRALGTKSAVLCGPLAATGGAPWLGNDAYCDRTHFQLDAYLGNISAACRRLKSLDPGISCLAPFETALSPCQLTLANGTPPVRLVYYMCTAIQLDSGLSRL